MSDPDVVVIGSGPNGLAAAVHLARQGAKVLVLEARDEIGGGVRSAELTLPGFVHDVCSAAHPMGILSPYFRTLPLEEHGLRWLRPKVSVAHPLDDGPAVILRRSLDETAAELGDDGPAYKRLLAPLLANPHGLLADALGPLGFPPTICWRVSGCAGCARRWAGATGPRPRARALLAGAPRTPSCR